MIRSEAFLLFSGGKVDHKYLTAFAALKLMTDGPKKTHHRWKETCRPNHDPAVTSVGCGIMFEM